MPWFILMVLLVLVVLVGARTALEIWRGAQARLAPGASAAPDPGRLDRVETALADLESRLMELQEQQQFLERLLARRHEDEALPPGRDAAPSAEAEDSILFDTGREES